MPTSVIKSVMCTCGILQRPVFYHVSRQSKNVMTVRYFFASVTAYNIWHLVRKKTCHFPPFNQTRPRDSVSPSRNVRSRCQCSLSPAICISSCGSSLIDKVISRPVFFFFFFSFFFFFFFNSFWCEVTIFQCA